MLQQQVAKVKCASSLGKRKVDSLSGSTLHPCDLSAVINPSWEGVRANCWLRDEEGRELGFVLTLPALTELHEKIGIAIKEYEAWKGQQTQL